jgi:hypothetical protein
VLLAEKAELEEWAALDTPTPQDVQRLAAVCR